jgi:hypothetical protein
METNRESLGTVCGARTRRGYPCRKCASAGRARCRLHGGLSTGPKTPEGVRRIQLAKTLHGRYSKTSIVEHREVVMLIRQSRALLSSLSNG